MQFLHTLRLTHPHLEKKLCQAMKAGDLEEQDPDYLDQAVRQEIITLDELKLLKRSRELRQRIIAVDAFEVRHKGDNAS